MRCNKDGYDRIWQTSSFRRSHRYPGHDSPRPGQFDPYRYGIKLEQDQFRNHSAPSHTALDQEGRLVYHYFNEFAFLLDRISSLGSMLACSSNLEPFPQWEMLELRCSG